MGQDLEPRIASGVKANERNDSRKVDRDDPATAAKIVERLVREAGPRATVVRVFEELVTRAHERGTRKWAITLFADKFRLNVGTVHVGVLLSEMLFLVVDPARLDAATHAALGPRVRATRSSLSTGLGLELYLPVEDVEALWPGLRTASLAFVDSAAKRDTPYWKSHSSGLLGYFNEVLGYAVPRLGKPRQGEGDGKAEAEEISPEVAVIAAVVARARKDLPPERVSARERALVEARLLIEARQGSLSTEDLAQLVRLFNAYHQHGRVCHGRFGQAMGGNSIAEQVEAAKQWIDALWMCERDEEVAAALDRLLVDVRLRQAGLSFPTMVLHCKESTRWFPAQSEMLAQGYSLLVGITPEDGPSYVRCCAALRALIEEHRIPPVGLDIVALFADQLDELDAVEVGMDATEPPPTAVTYDRTTFLAETLFVEGELKDIERLLQDKPQIVLHGPPGTGKTWIAERLARYLTGGDRERIGVVQFHPSYGYEDFIEGIRPRSDGARVTYPVESGVFLEFCERAALRPDERHVLVIDEINRGNLPRIFGELLFALERRGEPVTLAQSRRTIQVPGNVVLIGTMNTADQSIVPIDLALRRRFHFVRLKPEPERLERWLATHAPAMKAAAAVLDALNAGLEQLGVPHDRLVGHSHFMRRGLDEAGLELLWRASIMPLIEELLHGQDEAIGGFEHAAFVVPRLAPTK